MQVGFRFHHGESRLGKQICSGHRAPGVEMMIRIVGPELVFDRFTREIENGKRAREKFGKKSPELIERVHAVFQGMI